MEERISMELSLLKEYYNEVVFVETGRWVFVGDYKTPSKPEWEPNEFAVCFQIPNGYPGAPPYGFYAPSSISCGGSPPQGNYRQTPPSKPPFEGNWGFFSWSHDSSWKATADLKTGSNLANFIRSFGDRFGQGV